MVFVSDRQRRGFFATGNFKREPRGGIGDTSARSYIDGKKLKGNFKTVRAVFKKFPKEKPAFNKVMRFNRRTGKNITHLKQIPNQKKVMKISRRWDR